MAGKIVGLGGIFVKSEDPEKTKAWYRDVLGVDITDYGAHFKLKDDDHKGEGYTVWGLFKSDTDYMKPSDNNFMINFRVDDLEAFIADLKSKGVELVGEMISEPYGKFAWIMDPDGTKIELWQQVGGLPDGC